MGESFEEIFEELENLDPVYFPNGIIGQHALYTLFENTLRNIKHYKEILPRLQRDGVRLFVSIQEESLLKRIDDRVDKSDQLEKVLKKSLYKIGTWLHHPQRLLHEEGARINEEKDPFNKDYGTIIGTHTQKLKKRVVDEDGNPILGGSSQDKVCASMLMNNLFSSIDEMDLNMVKRQYYPYVMAASEFFQPYKERTKGFSVKHRETFFHKAYENKLARRSSIIRAENYKAFENEYIGTVLIRKEEGLEDKGTIKKYFHLWKSAKCHLIEEELNLRNENVARFKVLAVDKYKKFVPSENGELKECYLDFRKTGSLKDKENSAEFDLRNKGIIRVVKAKEEWHKLVKQNAESNKEKEDQMLYELAMKEWLGEWLGFEKNKVGLVIHTTAIDTEAEIKDEKDLDAVPVWMVMLTRQEKSWELEIRTSRTISKNRNEEEAMIYKYLELVPKNENSKKKEGRLLDDYYNHACKLEEDVTTDFLYLVLRHGTAELKNPKIRYSRCTAI